LSYNYLIEKIDIINKTNKVIGQSTKPEVHEKGLDHRVSAVLLINEKQEFILPCASDKKVEAGKLFHSSAGHLSSGEIYIQCAVRELFEECGIKLNSMKLKYLG